jgi:hypothetical protein
MIRDWDGDTNLRAARRTDKMQATDPASTQTLTNSKKKARNGITVAGRKLRELVRRRSASA